MQNKIRKKDENGVLPCELKTNFPRHTRTTLMYGFTHSEWACYALFCETYDTKRLHVRGCVQN